MVSEANKIVALLCSAFGKDKKVPAVVIREMESTNIDDSSYGNHAERDDLYKQIAARPWQEVQPEMLRGWGSPFVLAPCVLLYYLPAYLIVAVQDVSNDLDNIVTDPSWFAPYLLRHLGNRAWIHDSNCPKDFVDLNGLSTVQKKAVGETISYLLHAPFSVDFDDWLVGRLQTMSVRLTLHSR